MSETPLPSSSNEDEFRPSDSERIFLLVSVFVLGACGLLYELVTGAAASYLMGDSVTQYSLVIGVFLAAMGVGSQLTRWLKRNLIDAFIRIQLGIAMVGGFSGYILFAAFPILDEVTIVVLGLSGVTGVLIGLELPILIRLMRNDDGLRINLAQVLSFDYVGALAASILFPFILLPQLGLVRAALACGALNAVIALLGTALFKHHLKKFGGLVVLNLAVLAALAIGFVYAERTTTFLEDQLYQDEIIVAETTPYQRIVITRWKEDIRLHLNGHLQFSSADEYRYHESLVMPALSAVNNENPRSDELRVLILGGGDGLAARLILRNAPVAKIDLVDLDQRVVELFRDVEAFSKLNDDSLSDPRLVPHYLDAMAYLRNAEAEPYDLIVIDLPDPGTVSTSKLYSKSFFGLALKSLKPQGALVTQASSPFFATEAFWCAVNTLRSANDSLGGSRMVTPYHVNVPSFGEWGFILLSPPSSKPPQPFEDTKLRFYTPEIYEQAKTFSPDIAEVPTRINTLSHPVIMEYYLKGWNLWHE